jgi:hypothetical protein
LVIRFSEPKYRPLLSLDSPFPCMLPKPAPILF